MQHVGVPLLASRHCVICLEKKGFKKTHAFHTQDDNPVLGASSARAFFERVQLAVTQARGWSVSEMPIVTTASVNLQLPHCLPGHHLDVARVGEVVRAGTCPFRLKRTNGRYAGALELEDALTGRGIKLSSTWKVQLTGCQHGRDVLDAATRLARLLAEAGQPVVGEGVLEPTANLVKVKLVLGCRLALDKLDAAIRQNSMVQSHRANAPGVTIRPTANIRASCNASLVLHAGGAVFVNSGGGLVGVAQGIEKLVALLNFEATALGGAALLPRSDLLALPEKKKRKKDCCGHQAQQALSLRWGYVEQTALLMTEPSSSVLEPS